MPDHTPYQDDDLFNPETHHEHSDVPVRPLWWALIIFIVFAIVTHIVLGFMYKGLVRAERNRMDPPQTAVARPADADVPKNQPLLQPFPRKDGKGTEIPPQQSTPVVDLIDMRAAEEQQLAHYGWVDRTYGVVHVPIDLAKDMLVARLAVAGATSPAAAPAPAATAPGAAAPPAPPATKDTGAVPPPATTGGAQ